MGRYTFIEADNAWEKLWKHSYHVVILEGAGFVEYHELCYNGIKSIFELCANNKSRDYGDGVKPTSNAIPWHRMWIFWNISGVEVGRILEKWAADLLGKLASVDQERACVGETSINYDNGEWKELTWMYLPTALVLQGQAQMKHKRSIFSEVFRNRFGKRLLILLQISLQLQLQ